MIGKKMDANLLQPTPRLKLNFACRKAAADLISSAQHCCWALPQRYQRRGEEVKMSEKMVVVTVQVRVAFVTKQLVVT